MKNIQTKCLLLLIFLAFGFLSVNSQNSLSMDNKRDSVLNKVCSLIQENYVFPDMAKKIVTEIKIKHKRGEYNGLTDADLAKTITADIQRISKDKHNVMVVKIKVGKPSAKKATISQETADYSKNLHNNGINAVKILPGNIGYFKYDGFENAKASGAAIQGVMEVLKNVDALILDLSDNRGGSPEMVKLLASYFLDKPTLLNRLYFRKSNEYIELRSHENVPGKRLGNIPLVIITTKKTASAAESFSYFMKHSKKAKIVGSPTSGGAHLADVFDIQDQFLIQLAIGRPINPITKSNWEGTGVLPSFVESKELSISKARSILLEILLSKTSDKTLRDIYKNELSKLKTQ